MSALPRGFITDECAIIGAAKDHELGSMAYFPARPIRRHVFADRVEFVAKGFEEPVRGYEVRWRE